MPKPAKAAPPAPKAAVPAPKPTKVQAAKGAPPKPALPGKGSPKAVAAKPAKGVRPVPVQAAAATTVCQEASCTEAALVRGFCRLHYIKNWKAIKARERRALRKRLSSYEDELIHKVPSDFDDRELGTARPLEIEMTRAREDVEEMFRELGFEDDL